MGVPSVSLASLYARSARWQSCARRLLSGPRDAAEGTWADERSDLGLRRVPIKRRAGFWHHRWLRWLFRRPSGCSPLPDFQYAQTWHGRRSLRADWRARLSGRGAITLGLV